MAWLLVALLTVLATCGDGFAQSGPEPGSAPPSTPVPTEEIKEIVQLLVDGQHESVIRRVDAFTARHALTRETFSVLLLKAESQRQLGRIDDAIHSYLATTPFIEQLHNVSQRRFVFVYFRLAMLYRRKAQPEVAVRFVTAGLAREPQNVYYQILLGELLRERGDSAQALQHLTTVLASPTPNPEERIVLQIKIDRLRGVTPPGPLPGLAAGPLHSGLSFGLVPFNIPDARVSASDLCLLLESKWLLPCALLPPVHVDDTQILDTRRRQCGGDRVLEELGRRYPADRRPHPLIIAVTGRDIFAPETNFVFSWQSPSTGLGVMSTHRFMAGLDDFYEPSVVATRRVAIQLLSTSGSLLGFTRPTQPECPLAYPHDVREFMLKGSRLCDSTVAEREALLRRRGGPSAPGGAAKAEEIGRLYRTYHFD